MVTVNQVTPITIPNLTTATSLTGNEYVPISQANSTVKTTISQMPQGMSAGVIVYGSSGGSPFPNNRTLAVDSTITITDGGPRGNLSLSVLGVNSNPPATITSSGVMGAITFDDMFLYVAIGTDKWRRVALSAF